MIHEFIAQKLSPDTVKTLEILLDGARRGEVSGIAYVAVLRRMRFMTDATGFCHSHPTFTRGCVDALADELGQMVHQRDPDVTR